MPSASRKLIKQILEINNIQLEAQVVEQTKILLLDTLGVSLAARQTPEAIRLRTALKASLSIKENDKGGRLWGSKLSASYGDAALYNGTLAHALELDDFGGADHSGAVIFPAIISAAELQGNISGLDFIKAGVAGYEVARRVLEAAGAYRAHNADAGWHSTATCGAPGAAVAAGLILQLNEQQLVDAVGLATSMIGGTWAFNVDGAMSKRLHPGWAASLGVNAALWAKAGISGPEFAFDADWGGFFNVHAKNTAEPEKLHTDFWEWPRILRSGIKPYPCCRDNHSVIDIMLDLHQQIGGHLIKVEKIEIHCIPEMYKMLSNARPKNMVEAQLSMPYCAAVSLLNGMLSLQHFKAEILEDHKIFEVVEMIHLISDATLKADSEPLVTIYMTNGEIINKTVPFAKGDHKNPLSRDAVIEKFSDMCKIGEVEKQSNNIVSFIFNLDKEKNIEPLLNLITA